MKRYVDFKKSVNCTTTDLAARILATPAIQVTIGGLKLAIGRWAPTLLLLLGWASSSAYAESPYPVDWMRQFGTADIEVGHEVISDGAGNVYMTGHSYGSLGSANAGQADFYLRKYDTVGNHLWTRQIGTAQEDVSFSVAVDSTGSPFVAGFTRGDLDGPSFGGNDAFLSKFDSLGNVLWSQQIGTPGFEEFWGIAVDNAGNAFVTGGTDSDIADYNAGSRDAILMKFNGTGALQWARQLGSTENELGYAVAVDATGNAFISGQTRGNLFGPNAGNDDAFLAKFDGAGSLLWSQQFGGAMDDQSLATAVDAAGNAYAAGYTTRTSLAGPSAGGVDVFLYKYDPLGNELWNRQIGSAFNEVAYDVAVDSAGSVFVSGETSGSLGQPSLGLRDAFLVKYDSTGNLVWSQQIGTADMDVSLGLTIDHADDVFMVGETLGSLAAPNAGMTDAFLVKFSSVPEPASGMLVMMCLLLVSGCRRQR